MQRSIASTPQPAKSAGQTLREFLSYSPSSRVKPQQIILFCRQLATFVRVGVPVTSAIHTFAEQTDNAKVREIYEAVAADLGRGVQLSEAFARHSQTFPPILIDMVRSAEVTGNLDQVLRQAARHIEREASARQKVRSAMIYPAIIVCFAVTVAVGMIAFVLPKFRDLYANLKVPLPGVLSFVLGISGFLGSHWLPLLLLALAAVIAIGYGRRTEKGRYWIDGFLLRLPLVAPLIRTATTERFCRTLGDMLAAGVPISQTYAVVVNNVSNQVYRTALRKVGPALAAGRGIFRPLQETGVFSPSVVQMVRVGEETGNLDSNLIECADMHEEELDYRIKKMTSILEPALIVFVGLLVGFVAVTMVTSIYSLAGSYH